MCYNLIILSTEFSSRKKPFSSTPSTINLVAPSTRWNNLGLWQSLIDSYSLAAERLAIHCGEMANLCHSDEIIDIGCGEGESIKLWLNKFKVKTVVALEPDKGAFNRAIDHVQNPKVQLLNKGTEALMNIKEASATKIIALDCAYLFRNKKMFWISIERLLEKKGKVVVTDIIWKNGATLNPIGKMALRLTGIPVKELLDKNSYHQQLEESGLTPLETVDLSSEVLDGFVRFYEQIRKQKDLSFSRKALLKVELTAKLIAWLRKKNLIEYILVTGEKQG